MTRRRELFTVPLTLITLLVLSACNTAAPQPAASTEATSFEFSADPQADKVTLSKSASEQLQTQALPEGSRVLIPNVDVSTENLRYRFVSPGKLVVRLKVKNITETLSFSQPFLFTLSAESKNIVRASAPLVTDAQLGGDGILSPGETSKRFSFEVTFKKNSAFSFLFDARAVVTEETGDAACTDPVVIPDENLLNIVNSTLKRSGDAPLTCDALAKLTELEIRYFGGSPADEVSRLTGLGQAVNLGRLILDLETPRSSSPLRSFSPLAELKNLTYFKVSGNLFRNLSPLAGLTKLKEIDLTPLESGGPRDISPLQNLVNLERLYLERGGSVEDISALENLTKLKVLELAGNDVRDVAPLARLTELDELGLVDNLIADLSPLLENSGLGEDDDEIRLAFNCFEPTDPAALAIIEQLEARNPGRTNVSYDDDTNRGCS